MGPHSRHTAQEGDAFFLLDERTLMRKVQISPRTTAKDLVKMPEETGTKVYTVEVGRLHTLRLESLKLIFQPLIHKLWFWQVS